MMAPLYRGKAAESHYHTDMYIPLSGLMQSSPPTRSTEPGSIVRNRL